MNDKSYNKWYSNSDAKLSEIIGNFVRHHRTAQHLNQEELAKQAGISRSTLSLLEKGETVTLTTLLQVLRILNQLHILEIFEIPQTISPIALAKADRAARRRVRKKLNTNKLTESEW